MRDMKTVIAGGGTGGHLFPALAVADELRKTDGSAEVTFVGSKRGLETRVVPAHGYRLEVLDVEGLKKRKGMDKARAVVKAGVATLAAIRLLRRLRPDGVIGTGGYSSGPLVLAARLLGIKTAILEQNAVPGLTNRLLGKVVDRVYIAFDEAGGYFPAGKVMLSGNPVREDILGVRDEAGINRTTRVRSNGRFSILVFGGSQGATALNAAFLDAIEYLTDIWGGLKVVHQTGSEGFDRAEAAYRRKGLKVELYRFIDDMATAYGSCDLIVCRAGATSIAEITALGLPAILVPYPFSSDSHQEVNAESLSAKGAAAVIRQEDLTGAVLAETIKRLYTNPFELKQMKDAVSKLARPGAAAAIVKDYTGFVREGA